MKKTLASLFSAVMLASSPMAQARGGPSEASAVSILVTGSVVLAISTLPLVALDSLFGGSVGKVQPAGNNMTDIEVRQKSTEKVTVIRVPDQSIKGAGVKTGQKADLVADANGHTLQIEGQPIAYVPNKSADGMLHSKPIK